MIGCRRSLPPPARRLQTRVHQRQPASHGGTCRCMQPAERTTANLCRDEAATTAVTGSVSHDMTRVGDNDGPSSFISSSCSSSALAALPRRPCRSRSRSLIPLRPHRAHLLRLRSSRLTLSSIVHGDCPSRVAPPSAQHASGHLIRPVSGPPSAISFCHHHQQSYQPSIAFSSLRQSQAHRSANSLLPSYFNLFFFTC